VSETFPAPGQKKAAPEKRKLFSNSFVPTDEPAPAPAARPKSKPAKPRAQ
jgi:hypothetical protein